MLPDMYDTIKVLGIVAWFLGSIAAWAAESNPADRETHSSETKPNTLLPEPTGLQYKPLHEVLDSIITSPELQNALIGAQVISITTGKTIFEHNPDQLINPASVSKIFTTSAALCLLSPSYRFKTEIYIKQRPTNGVVKGPMYVKGYGDPLMINERLTHLAQELKAVGIDKINGPIVLDSTYFDNVTEGPGWDQDDSSRPYMAPMGALSLNFNSAAVLVFPGSSIGAKAQLSILPDSDHFILENLTKTSYGRTWVRIKVFEKGNRTRVQVKGRVSIHHPGSRTYFRVTSPTMYFGRSFRQALNRAGIKTRRTIKLGTTPEWMDRFYVQSSPELGELVRKVNKRSQNFMAEQLFKTIGAWLLGPPASWHKGQQAMAAFLDEEIGIAPSTYVLHNGSGLNDVNRVTPRQVVKVLQYIWKRFDVWPDFVASMAVAGSDGTVAHRFIHPALKRTMRLKTGSLRHVRALAGYVHTRGGEVLAFSILISRYQCSGRMTISIINRFASALSEADADHMLVEEIRMPEKNDLIELSPLTGQGPKEGHEDAAIPIGENEK